MDDSKAERGSSFTKRGAPELVINEAPQRPPWGGKGVEDDTRYKFTRGGDDGNADGKADGAPASAVGSDAASQGPAKGQATGERPIGPQLPLGAGMHIQHAQGHASAVVSGFLERVTGNACANVSAQLLV